MQKNSPHLPVMVNEFLQYFADQHLTTFFDGTIGAGGHARALLEAHPEIERYIACDQDPEAIEIARKNLEPWKDKVEFVHGNFADLDRHLTSRGIKKVEGFFLTLESRRCNSTKTTKALASLKRAR